MNTLSLSAILAGFSLSCIPLGAGEDSVANSLFHEASLARIEEDSKSGLRSENPAAHSKGWRLSISPGFAYQRLGSLRVRGGAVNDLSGFPNLLSPSADVIPAIGPENAFGDRIYDDGFVNETGPTPVTGRTWFWGYDNADQINFAGNLVMSATGSRESFRQSIRDLGGRSTDRGLESLVPRLDFTLSPPSGESSPFQGLLISLGWFEDEVGSDYVSLTGQQALDQYRLDYRDTFDGTGLIFPGAGYRGTLDGPGVTIPNVPLMRDLTETLTGAEVVDFRNQVSLDIEVQNFSLAFGPTFKGSLGEKWTWNASFGPTLNFYRYHLRQNERVSAVVNGVAIPASQGFRSSKSGSEFGLGLFVRGGMSYQVNESWSLHSYLQGEYAESFEVSNGVSSYEVDPTGYSVGVGAGFQF